jgi:hypothetical protein
MRLIQGKPACIDRISPLSAEEFYKRVEKYCLFVAVLY